MKGIFCLGFDCHIKMTNFVFDIFSFFYFCCSRPIWWSLKATHLNENYLNKTMSFTSSLSLSLCSLICSIVQSNIYKDNLSQTHFDHLAETLYFYLALIGTQTNAKSFSHTSIYDISFMPTSFLTLIPNLLRINSIDIYKK